MTSLLSCKQSYHGEYHYNSVRAKDDVGNEGQKGIDGIALANGKKKEEEGEKDGQIEQEVEEVRKCVPHATHEDVIQVRWEHGARDGGYA